MAYQVSRKDARIRDYFAKDSTLFVDSTSVFYASLLVDNYNDGSLTTVDGVTGTYTTFSNPAPTTFVENSGSPGNIDIVQAGADGSVGLYKTAKLPKYSTLRATVRWTYDQRQAGNIRQPWLIAITDQAAAPAHNDIIDGGGTNPITLVGIKWSASDNTLRGYINGVNVITRSGLPASNSNKFWELTIERTETQTRVKIEEFTENTPVYPYGDAAATSVTSLESITPSKIIGLDRDIYFVLGTRGGDNANFLFQNQRMTFVGPLTTTFPLDGPVGEATITYRHKYLAKNHITAYTIAGTFAGGESVEVATRAGETEDEASAASFSAYTIGLSGSLDAKGRVVDVKVKLKKQSPAPTMTELTLTVDPDPDDEPMILSTQKIDTISATENPSQAANLIDKDRSTLWNSTTAVDATPSNLSYTPLADTVDALIVRNTNVKEIEIQLKEATLTTTIKATLTAGDNIIFFDRPYTLTAVSATISTLSSQTPNQVRYIGELLLCRVLMVLPNLDRFEPNHVPRRSGVQGTISGGAIGWRGKTRRELFFLVTRVSKSKRDEFLSVYDANPTVNFWAEPANVPEDLFEMLWTADAVAIPYSHPSVKPVGWNIQGSLVQT